MRIMQKISHGTRAFIWNSDGLQGFIVKFEIIDALKREEKSGTLGEVCKHQLVELDVLANELSKLETLK